jgi:quinoprotein glucose dehydrogenase
MPAFAENTLTAQNLTTLMAYLTNPAAGAAPARAAASPPPEGVTRYTGRLGAMLFAKNGLSAISPPWGQIVAYDLNEGTIKWQAPLGTVPELAAKGIMNTGNNNRLHASGPVVTAGGLIFVGMWADRFVRAYDKDTGKILWEKELDASPQGIPAVYEVGGREYVVWCAVEGGGARPEGSIAFKDPKPGAQGYYVFALPNKK